MDHTATTPTAETHSCTYSEVVVLEEGLVAGADRVDLVGLTQERLQRTRVLQVAVLGRPQIVERALLVRKLPHLVRNLAIVRVLRQDRAAQLR